MKKIFVIIFLLMSGLLLLLATVDLEPYLIAEPIDIAKKIAHAPVLEADNSPEKTEVVDPLANLAPEIPVENQTVPQAESETPQGNLEKINLAKSESAATVATITAEPEKIAPSPAEKVPADIEKQEQISSPLIELEAKILPVGEYPYSILLETFIEKDSAQQGLSAYKKKGISAHWVKVGLGENIIRYRLFTGAFATAAEAQQYLDQNNLAGKLIKRTEFSSRVGVYMDKAQLAGAFIKTREADVIPYILGTKKGDYYLYVGAFYTLTGATNKCQTLVKAGLTCEPVRRSTYPPQ